MNIVNSASRPVPTATATPESTGKKFFFLKKVSTGKYWFKILWQGCWVATVDSRPGRGGLGDYTDSPLYLRNTTIDVPTQYILPSWYWLSDTSGGSQQHFNWLLSPNNIAHILPCQSLPTPPNVCNKMVLRNHSINITISVYLGANAQFVQTL